MSGKRIVIIGAGLGGICAGIKFKEAGHEDITILEKNPKVGGTWYDNTYPGCACDVQVALYQYSFAQSVNWTRLYPSSQEIQAYIEEIVERYQLGPNLRLSTPAKSAEWRQSSQDWLVTTEAGEEIVADIVVGALGQLNRPNWPDMEGLDGFSGAKMHSARWDHSVDFTGKKVGVIGAAASAIQLIPQIAKTAGKVTVFQRTPNWIIPRMDRAITLEEKMLMMTDPELAVRLGETNRQLIWEQADKYFWQAFKWTEAGRAAYDRIARNHLEEQVEDPALRAKLTPDYPVGCKRILISDDYYPALQRDNVELETGPIARIQSNGVEMQDGSLHACDILVFATGFETTGWNWSVDVVGSDGVHLNDAWSQAPQAYKGVTVNGFPNFFVLYGPNTNLGHNSIIYMLERQVEYAVKVTDAMADANYQAFEPTKTAQDSFNADLQRRLAETVWADPTCSSWYKNDEGLITQNWCGSTQDYADEVANVVMEDYAPVS